MCVCVWMMMSKYIMQRGAAGIAYLGAERKSNEGGKDVPL